MGRPYFTGASKAATQRWILTGRLNLPDARALTEEAAARLTELAKRIGWA
jgi:hypothetical protein